MAEEQHEAWAARLSHWLVRAYRRRQRCGEFSERQFKRALARYHALLRSGRRLHPRGQWEALPWQEIKDTVEVKLFREGQEF